MIWVKRSLVILSLLAAWSLCAQAGLFNAYLLPPPGKIAALAGRMLLDGSLGHNIRISLVRVVTGFGIAFALAFSSTVFAIQVLQSRGEMSSRHATLPGPPVGLSLSPGNHVCPTRPPVGRPDRD